MAAATPQETDPSGTVVQKAIDVIANVKGDEETAGMEKAALATLGTLLTSMHTRNEAQNQVSLAAGVLNGSKNKTNREVRLFGSKLAGQLATERVPGEKHASFVRIFDGKTAKGFLPETEDDRLRALVGLEKQVGGDRTPADEKKLAAGSLKALDKERAARTAHDKAKGVLATAKAKEEVAKKKTVVAVRAMSLAVQGKFAEEPSRAREVLGWGEPSARKTAAGAAKAAKKAKKAKDTKDTKGAPANDTGAGTSEGGSEAGE